MPGTQWVVLAAAVLAAVAVLAVVLLGLALRRSRAEMREAVDHLRDHRCVPDEPRPSAARVRLPSTVPVVTTVTGRARGGSETDADGATLIESGDRPAPSQVEVVHAALGRPLVRGAVLTHGVAYALRAESRDRIRALVRREYRRRRKIRLRAGRRAARSAAIPPAEAQSWLGSGTSREARGAR